MHEVSLVVALVEQIEGLARSENFESVKKIRLAVGRLSGVEPECLEFCYSEGVKGTILAGAVLELEVENILVKCKNCEKETTYESPELLICASCGSSQTEVKKGKDFRVLDLEVNDYVSRLRLPRSQC